MHLSPSDPNYVRNLLGQLSRATCWNKKPPQDDLKEDGQ